MLWKVFFSASISLDAFWLFIILVRFQNPFFSAIHDQIFPSVSLIALRLTSVVDSVSDLHLVGMTGFEALFLRMTNAGDDAFRISSDGLRLESARV